MQTTALEFPVTVPPWQKPTSVIRVLRRPRLKPKRVPSAAVNKPHSKWTVLAALILAVLLHVAPVAIVEMKLEGPPLETAQAIDHNTAPTAVD